MKVRLSKMGKQDNTIMAGEGGLLSKIETGNPNKSDGTGQEGRNRKERKSRKYRADKKYVEIAILHNMIKSEKDRKGQKGM